MKIYEDITRTIGNTPTVRLNKIPPEGATIWAKLEFFNPCSSIKDRHQLYNYGTSANVVAGLLLP